MQHASDTRLDLLAELVLNVGMRSVTERPDRGSCSAASVSHAASLRTTRLRLSSRVQWLGVSMLKEQSASSSARSAGACSVSRMPRQHRKCIVVTDGAFSETSPCNRTQQGHSQGSRSCRES